MKTGERVEVIAGLKKHPVLFVNLSLLFVFNQSVFRA